MAIKDDITLKESAIKSTIFLAFVLYGIPGLLLIMEYYKIGVSIIIISSYFLIKNYKKVKRKKPVIQLSQNYICLSSRKIQLSDIESFKFHGDEVYIYRSTEIQYSLIVQLNYNEISYSVSIEDLEFFNRKKKKIIRKYFQEKKIKELPSTIKNIFSNKIKLEKKVE